MKNKEFRIGVLGLTQVERLTIASVCSLTHSRARGFQVLPPERCAEAEIMLVDADDASAVQLWNASPHGSGRAALMISRDPQVLSAHPYSLPRASFAARLVRQLDHIAMQEFKYFRAMTVGGDHALTGSFSHTGQRETDLPGTEATGEHRQFNDVRADQVAQLSYLQTGAYGSVATATSTGIQTAMQTGIHTGLHALPRVLIIDNCRVVQAKMRALLGMHGLTTDLVDNAEQGLELMRTTRYAIVFLDIVLPGMDGYRACRRMKTIDRTFTPIVMLSSRGSALDRMRAHMAGCQRYLTKPIAVETLQKVLCDFIPAETLTMATASVSGAHRPLAIPNDRRDVSGSTVLARRR